MVDFGTPSIWAILDAGNAVSVGNLVYLAAALEKPEWLDRAEATVATFTEFMSRSPRIASPPGDGAGRADEGPWTVRKAAREGRAEAEPVTSFRSAASSHAAI